jgi:hypothetical protein
MNFWLFTFLIFIGYLVRLIYDKIFKKKIDGFITFNPTNDQFDIELLHNILQKDEYIYLKIKKGENEKEI